MRYCFAIRYLVFSVVINLLISGCKKDRGETVSNPQQGPCVCQKGNVGSAVGNQIPCNGFLSITTYSNVDDVCPSYTQAQAYFNNVSSTQENGNFVTVDSVLLDERTLSVINDANNAPMYYWRNLSQTTQQKWCVYGGNGIPTFTFTADLKDPIADFSKVPDQISKDYQEAFTLNGVANITRATVIIGDESGKTYWDISVSVNEGTNKVCFPQDQLKLLGPGKANLLIELENTRVQTFNSRNIVFSKKLQYSKNIILNP
jgi:hypothetical protein